MRIRDGASQRHGRVAIDGQVGEAIDGQVGEAITVLKPDTDM